jgi:membrane protein implicated in regulation of membrane protease activity
MHTEEDVMAQTRSPRTHVGIWIVIAIVLAAALVGTLWVPFYNHITPALGGFPFFYWYQLMWVPIVAILSAVAYGLSRLAQRGSGTSAAGPPGTRARGDAGEVS